jgi:hypothetical protein
MKLLRWHRWVAWVALLPVGILFLQFAQPLYRNRSDDRGFGTFYGFAGGKFFSDEVFMFIRFEGRTKPEWRWARPPNYRYSEMDFEWDTEDSNGSGRLDLTSMMLENSDGTTPIDHEWFYRMTEQEDLATAFMDLLNSARDGTLPKPRHHTHYLHEKITGSLAHFSCGRRYPYALLVWAFIWMAATVYRLIRCIRQSNGV